MSEPLTADEIEEIRRSVTPVTDLEARLLATLDAARPAPVGLDAIETFVNEASANMLGRMREGERRGWGNSWQTDYPDEKVKVRLGRAEAHLDQAFRLYREGSVGLDEVRKRAADLANQAFMLADPERLAQQREGDVERIMLAELPNILSLVDEYDQSYEYSEEPGSPYVKYLAEAIAAALAAQQREGAG